jgi:D-alanyl-D-alanine carboxypeptidase
MFTNDSYFRNICATSEFTIQPTNKTPTARILKNTNSLLTEDLKYDLIGKTGYTDEAGNTFICFATYNGKNVICGLYDGPNYRKSIFKDVQMLLSNVFDNYSKTKILDKNTISISYLDKKTNKNYILGLDSDIYCLTDGNKYVLDYTFSDISVTNNTASGKINIHLQNNNFELNKTYDLNLLKSEKYSSNDSDGSMLTSIVIYILVLLGLVIVIFILILKQRYKKYLRYKRLKNLEKLNRFR